MAFISAFDVSSKQQGRRGGKVKSSSDVVVATDVAGRASEDPVYSFRISFSDSFAKKARIIAGDRVDVLFDKTTSPARCLVRRVPTNGWKLGGSGHAGGRLVTKFNLRPGFPTFKKSTGCDAVITDEGVLFDLPTDCSFEHNKRDCQS